MASSTPKDWANGIAGATPITATSLEDMEGRLKGPYTNVQWHGAVTGDTGDQSQEFQEALNSFTSAGGTVHVPAGTYRLAAGITIPPKVSLVGDGQESSILNFPTSTGADTWGVSYNTADEDVYQQNHISDLRLQGPAHGASLVYGTAGTNMHGLRYGRRTQIYRCSISGFNKGLGVNNDHNYVFGTSSVTNHHNVSFEAGTATRFGDHQFIGCDFASASYSSINVEPLASVQGCSLIGTHLGFAPYGIYGQPGRSSATFILGLRMFNSPFENIGNALIRGDDTLNHVVKYWEFYGGGTSIRQTSVQIPASTFDYYVKCSDVLSSRIDCIDMFPTAPATAYFALSGNVAMGDTRLKEMNLGSLAAALPLVDEGGTAVTWTGRTGESGFLAGLEAGATAGQLLRVAASGSVRPYQTSLAGMPRGFAYDAGSTGGAIRVQTGGEVDGAIADGAISNGFFVKPSTTTDGRVVQASSWTDGPIVGVALSSAAGAGDTLTVEPRGMGSYG